MTDAAPATEPQQQAEAGRSGRWTTVLKIGFAVGLIAWLAQRGAVDTQTLLGVLARPLTLGPVVLLAMLGISMSAWRWQLLVRAEGIPMPLKAALQLTWIGHFFNMVFPGAVSGDAVKMYYVGHLAPTRREEAWTTVLADRVIGMVALVSVATAAALANAEFMWSRPSLQGTLLLLVGILAAAFLGGASLAFGLWDRVTEAAWFGRLPGSGLFRRAQQVLARLSRRPGLLLATFAISFLAHWIAVTNGYLIGQVAREVAAELALEVPADTAETDPEVTDPEVTDPEVTDPDDGELDDGELDDGELDDGELDAEPAAAPRALGYVDYCALFPVALVANAIPLTPGGIGVGEGVLGTLFTWAGGTEEEGVTVMLLYRVLFYLLALLGAVVYMAYKRGPPPTEVSLDGAAEPGAA